MTMAHLCGHDCERVCGQEADLLRMKASAAEARIHEIEAREQELTNALERVAAQQPKTLGWIRAHGIVFNGPLGKLDPKNWEQVAFSIYSDMCETDTIARAALAPAVEEQR